VSSLFYIWDANEHHPDVKITTLEQAEYDSIFKKSVFPIHSYRRDVLAPHKYSDDILGKK
jgi:hypothetical protein